MKQTRLMGNPFSFMQAMLHYEYNHPTENTLAMLLGYLVKKAGGRIELPRPEEMHDALMDGKLNYEMTKENGKVVGSYLEFVKEITIDSTAKVKNAKSPQLVLTGEVVKKKVRKK